MLGATHYRRLLFFGVLLALFLSGCNMPPFCGDQSYSYREQVPVYKDKTDVDKIESLAPREVHNTGKIFRHNNLLLVGEVDKGIHVFDNANPSAPVPVAFLSIPGNHDLYVAQDGARTLLYADNYTNLVTLDITSPKAATVLNRVRDVFSNYYEVTDQGILVGYEQGKLITTHLPCGMVPSPPPMADGGNAGPSSPTAPGGGETGGVSQGGSLSRFALIKDYLFTLDQDAIQSFRLEAPDKPVAFNRTAVNFGIETLFYYPAESGDQLFVGSMDGLYIMDASDLQNLKLLGKVSHVIACDPVVVQGTLAYVTLRGSCTGESNRLEIMDIADPKNPKTLKGYTMQEPYGLGVDGDYLFICDGIAGLKVYKNARLPEGLELQQQISGLEPRDVIPFGGLMIVVAKDGLYQYDYSQIASGTITQLSKIPAKPDPEPEPQPVPVPEPGPLPPVPAEQPVANM